MKAIVVFHDKVPKPGFWVRLYGRPGFKHCFVALNDGRAWIEIDGCANGTFVEASVAATYDLAAFYRDRGYRVVETRARPDGAVYPWQWFSCVELAKRILGLRGWCIWSPYALYRRLTEGNQAWDK